MARRYFALDDARALLPQIRSQMTQALQLHAHLRAAVGALSDAGVELSWDALRDEVDDELDDDLDDDQREHLLRARMLYSALRDAVQVIEGLGADVKGVVDGLVDFHSWREGVEEVVLCWRLGEPDIAWYHGVDDGFAGRKSVRGERFTSERREPAPDQAEAR